MPGRKRKTIRLVELRLVENAELDWIHLEPLGHLVHCRFGGIKSGDRAGTTHVGRSTDIASCPPEAYPQVGDAVMERRGLAAVFVVSVEYRHVIDVIVPKRHE